MTGPEELRRRTTRAGRMLLPFLAAGVVFGWLLGGPSGLFGATLLALLIVAALAQRVHAAGIELELPGAHRATVGRRFEARLVARRRGAPLAARDLVIFQGARTSADSRPAGFVARLAPGTPVEVPLDLRLAERGETRRLALTVVSTFPFGLFRSEARFEVPCDLLGLPRLGALAGTVQPPRAPDGALGVRRALDGEEELAQIRDWRPGESQRRMHWKHTARRDRLVVCEEQPRARGEARVVLAAVVSELEPWTGRSASFEKAVSLTATLVERHLAAGYVVKLGLAREEGEAVRWTRLEGRAALRKALVRLARAVPGPGDPWRALRGALAPGRAPGRARVTPPSFAVLAGGARAESLPGGATTLDIDERATSRRFQAAPASRAGAVSRG